MKARLLSEMDSLQRAVPVPEVVLPPIPSASEVFPALSDSLERIVPPRDSVMTEEAHEVILSSEGVNPSVWRLYMDKVEKVHSMTDMVRRFAVLVENKRLLAETASEEELPALLDEIALLEEVIPLLTGELDRLICERDEYEISFVGGSKD